MQRFRSAKASIFRSVGGPVLKKKVSNSWAAIEDTFYSTKDTFERHRVVFTVGTSIASLATACIGYSLRHLHDTRVDHRLNSIEQAMKKNQIEDYEIRKIIKSGSVSVATCAAAASISLVLGYGLGWRGGKWYASRKFRKEQMKLLGQAKPRWKLQFIKRPLTRLGLHQFIKRPLTRLRLGGGNVTKAPTESTNIEKKTPNESTNIDKKTLPSSCK